ncbi:alpha/beta hydrolase [Niabella aquatica]
MIESMLPFLKWFLFILAFLLLAGILFEQYSRWKLEKTAFTGKPFVEINGKPLHYVKKGQGNCTVVFQSGMGSSYAIWQEIQDSISQNAVTIAYDRNGLMLSEATDAPVTNDQVAEELQLLLEKTNCPKPYILVGHSMAGIYLRPFIKKNEQDIAGIVFVEASHPQQIKKASPELLKALSIPPRWLIKFAVNTGIYRTMFSFVPLSPEIPMNHPLHRLEKDFFYRSCDKILEEVENDALNFKNAEKYTSFGNIPLTVITGTSEIRYAAIKDTVVRNEYRQWVDEMQHDLLKLSANSWLIKAPNSGHLVQINDGALLIREIRNMLSIENH